MSALVHNIYSPIHDFHFTLLFVLFLDYTSGGLSSHESSCLPNCRPLNVGPHADVAQFCAIGLKS